MTTLTRFTFAVYNLDDDPPFDAFLMDVPSVDGDEDRAARRAWWQAFHLLGPRGVEPEDFQVCCWRNNTAGPAVGMGGIL